MNSAHVAMQEQYDSYHAPMRELPFLFRLFRRFETHRIDAVSKLIEGKRLKVLEVGCGDGNFLYKNKDRWKQILGVDVVHTQLQKAKKRNYGVPSSFAQQDFGQHPMPFPSSSVDIVVSIATLQYVLDLDLFFSEVHRVLKRKGQLLIEVPNSAVFWRRLYFLLGKFPKTTEYENKWNGGVLHYFTQENLADFLEKKGFKVYRVTCSGIFDTIRSFAPGILGANLIIDARKL